MDMISHSASLTYIFNMVNDYKHHKRNQLFKFSLIKNGQVFLTILMLLAF
jgi:hypothetical protein